MFEKYDLLLLFEQTYREILLEIFMKAVGMHFYITSSHVHSGSFKFILAKICLLFFLVNDTFIQVEEPSVHVDPSSVQTISKTSLSNVFLLQPLMYLSSTHAIEVIVAYLNSFLFAKMSTIHHTPHRSRLAELMLASLEERKIFSATQRRRFYYKAFFMTS